MTSLPALKLNTPPAYRAPWSELGVWLMIWLRQYCSHGSDIKFVRRCSTGSIFTKSFFSHSGRAKNEARAKKWSGGGGRGKKGTLARKPFDFVNAVRPRTGLLIGAAWLFWSTSVSSSLEWFHKRDLHNICELVHVLDQQISIWLGVDGTYSILLRRRHLLEGKYLVALSPAGFSESF